MHFNAKFASLLLAVATSAFSAEASVIARDALTRLSVIFYDEVGLTGSSYSPDTIVPGVCHTLPGTWLDRPESINIGRGFSCTLFGLQGCEGTGILLNGTVNELPSPSLYDNIESLSCNKLV